MGVGDEIGVGDDVGVGEEVGVGDEVGVGEGSYSKMSPLTFVPGEKSSPAASGIRLWNVNEPRISGQRL